MQLHGAAHLKAVWAQWAVWAGASLDGADVDPTADVAEWRLYKDLQAALAAAVDENGRS